MTQKEFDTLSKFVKSNDSFCNALNNGENPQLDQTIMIELILYYLTLNKEYLSNMDNPHKFLYLSLLEDYDFIIEDNSIIYMGTEIPLSELVNVVNEIEHHMNTSNSKIVYFINAKNKHEPKLIHYQKSQIIKFSEIQKNIFYTGLERANIYERTTKVNQDTLPYINHTKHDFIALINDIVLHAINGSLDNYNKKYLKVVSAYLNLFPFTVYAKAKKEVPFSQLSLPQNEIGIRTTTINNPLIDEIEKNLALLLRRENSLLVERERYECDLSFSTKVLTLIEQELIEIDKDKANYFFSLFVLRNSPEIYNENLLMYLTKSFQAGTVEINRFLANPIIKLFYIEQGQTKFHSSMRLDTLLSLINSKELLEILSEQKTLKLDM